MQLKTKSPILALKPTYRKDNIKKADFEQFIAALQRLSANMEGGLGKSESEKYFEGLLNGFLADAFYKGRNEINTKTLYGNSAIDSAIYINDKVGVLIEVKEPTKTAEMISRENLYKKSFYEAVMYYLYEKVINDNNEIKHIIITNLNEWFVFDATEFNRLFYQDTKLKNQFQKWKNKKLDNSTTQQMYDIIAKQVKENDETITCTYIPLKEYRKHLDNDGETHQKKRTALFKILSPRHLLKEQTANDSNSLNTDFYNELLHIIGLEDVKDKKGSKRIIQRKENREFASLLENTIEKIRTRGVLRKLEDIEQYGSTEDEQLFSIGLELCLTWINRILFLKLLESQLLAYHKGKKEYKFLSSDNIQEFDNLETLFFEVLAIQTHERSDYAKSRFPNVPYLNSSLFEPSDLEKNAAYIAALKDNLELTIHRKTVLKNNDKRATGKLSTLEYLLRFLDAYDFGAEGSEEIQDDAKTLINASVLGLIFEKINGYKEGSFYTPGFITMYMCRETIRRAVTEKLNQTFGWKCKQFKDLKNKLDTEHRQAANTAINQLTVCDPAVGSGHFLVSALNEIISIKHDLKILSYHDGDHERIKYYEIEIDNDELIIADDEGNPFKYTVNENGTPNKQKQRIQETLFNEKRTIIENCLFGVDINPNSVKICRLRLWIELLKHAYYTLESQYQELQTLPNIDINIKQGNSLISRFNVDDNKNNFDAARRQRIRRMLPDYKKQVEFYKSVKDKNAKAVINKKLKEYRSIFQKMYNPKDQDYIKWKKAESDWFASTQSLMQDAKVTEKLLAEATELKEKYQQKTAIYDNAFEWRFEFPEVLDDKDGQFIGFDCVIGNPPYIKEYTSREVFNGLRSSEYYQGKMDIWYFFTCIGLDMLKANGNLCFIAPNNWTTNSGASKMRNKVIRDSQIKSLVDFGAYMIFDSADIQTMVMLFQKNKNKEEYKFDYRKINVNNPDFQNALGLITKNKTDNNIIFKAKILRKNLIDKLITFNRVEIQNILDIILKFKNLIFDGKEEVAQGIVCPQDFVNKKSASILENSNVGDGVFVINDLEKEKLDLSQTELEIIKPYHTSKELEKYYGSKKNLLWIIYTDSHYKSKDSMADMPSLKDHLDQFQNVITSSNKPYGLHRARKEKFFIGEKIIVKRKCPDEPVFTYTNFDCYVSATFYVIKTERINQLYLTGFLNSKLIAFWLKNKGKMQGNNYQIDKEPLLEIPIYQPKQEQQLPIINLVKTILEKKSMDISTEVEEQEIDQLVYALYDLTAEEVAIIEAAVG